MEAKLNKEVIALLSLMLALSYGTSESIKGGMNRMPIGNSETL